MGDRKAAAAELAKSLAALADSYVDENTPDASPLCPCSDSESDEDFCYNEQAQKSVAQESVSSTRPRAPTASSLELSFVDDIVRRHNLLSPPNNPYREQGISCDASGNEAAWRAYSAFRAKTMEKEAKCAFQALVADGRDALLNQADALSASGAAPGAQALAKQVFFGVMDAEEHANNNSSLLSSDDTTFRLLRVKGTVFSPFALPRALQMYHSYHRSDDGKEIAVKWAFRTIVFHADGSSSKNPWICLCTNKISTHDEKNIGKDAAKNEYRQNIIDRSNLSRGTLIVLRKWLLGTELSSRGYIDDLSLIRLLFASTFTPLTPVTSTPMPRKTKSFSKKKICDADTLERCHRNSKLYARPFGLVVAAPNASSVEPRGTKKLRSKLPCAGILAHEVLEETSWLEYSVRCACNALREQDKHFQQRYC